MEEKNIAVNRIVNHDYFVLSKIEAGIVLDGAEVKSIRNGGCNLKDSFCVFYNGEMLLKNMHISVYDKAGAFSYKDAKRDRKLLLHKDEIVRLKSKMEEKGLTIVPLRLYYKQALIKVEIALCKGKHTFDKKQDLKNRDIKRESERIIKTYK